MQRELVLCSHDILAVKRDHVARSALARSPFFLPDVSSESVTTSLKGHTDDYKSCSEAFQRSDDVTVDSTVSVKQRTKVAGAVDDQRTEDDCSTAQNHFTQKHLERQHFAGKQIPHRPSSVTTCNLTDDGGWRSKSKKVIYFASFISLSHPRFLLVLLLNYFSKANLLIQVLNRSKRCLRKNW